VSAYLTDIGALASGGQQVGVGVALAFLALALTLTGNVLGFLLLLRQQLIRLSAERGTALWAMLAGATGIVYAVGFVMPWITTSVHATTPTWIFRGTGTANISSSCCSLVQTQGWDLAHNIMLIALVLTTPFLAATWQPVRAGVASMFGLALVLLASPLSAIVDLGHAAFPSAIGMSITDAQAAGAIATDQGSLGLWPSLIAAACLALFAGGRALQSSSRPPQP
jgi:hypothetical protein